MVNISLMHSINVEGLIELGFTEENDGSESPWGVDWNLLTNKFHICIDCTFEVKLKRIDVDSDWITILVDDKHDLEQLIAFIS